MWPWVWVPLEARRGCLIAWAGVTGSSESPSMGAVTTSEGSSAEDPVRVLFCKSPQGWLTILIARWLRSMNVLWQRGSITLHFPLLLLHYIGRKREHKRGHTDWFWICLVAKDDLEPSILPFPLPAAGVTGIISCLVLDPPFLRAHELELLCVWYMCYMCACTPLCTHRAQRQCRVSSVTPSHSLEMVFLTVSAPAQRYGDDRHLCGHA